MKAKLPLSRHYCIILLLLARSPILAHADVSIVEDGDFGNSLETAYYASPATGASIEGSIGYEGDVDYFVFVVEQGHSVTYALSGGTTAELLDSDGNVLRTSQNTYPTGQFSIRVWTSPGTYYLRLSKPGSTSANYFFTHSWSRGYYVAPPWERPPDSSADDSPPDFDPDPWDGEDDSPPGFTTGGNGADAETLHGTHTLSRADTGDWYRFYLWKDKSYRFWTTGSDDIKVELYADIAATQLVGSGDNSGGDGQFDLDFIPSTSQNYYLRISSSPEGQNAEYTFRYQGGLSGWYFKATDLGANWVWLNWLGSFNVSQDTWIFHPQHGWLFPFAEGPESVYFWDNAMGTFLWTSDSIYPSMYRFSDGNWIFYQKGTKDPRNFVDLVTGVWEQW